MNDIFFTIITVCFNPGGELGKTLASVRKQSFDSYEIIVKDGMSTDGSVDGLAYDSDVRFVSQRDRGIYDAMNQAVSLAQGRYIMFLNCGDYLADEHVLDNIHRRIVEDKCGSRMYYGDIYNRSVDCRISSNPRIDAFACYRNMPCHQAIIYDASLMRERSFDINYRVRADHEHFMWCYFVKAIRPVYLDLVISSYEGGGFSESREGLELSKKEFKKITALYMTGAQRRFFAFLLFITGAPLRRKLAESRHFSGLYNKVKGLVYAAARGHSRR